MLTIGANHRTAAAATLADFARAAAHLQDGLRSGAERSGAPLRELAVLATCNRVELYAVAEDGRDEEVFDALAAEVFGVGVDVVGGPRDSGWGPYRLRGSAAVRHLCRVAAGLDSVVIGEHQISGQVAQALRGAWHVPGDRHLECLAAVARRATGRVRTETGLSRHAASISSVAVDLLGERLGGLGDRTAVVVGAGKAGLLAGRALRAAGVASLTVANRSPERAEQVAGELGASAAPLDRLAGLMAAADLVVTATGAEGVVVDAATVNAALAERHSGPLLVLDLAMPNDVDPSVGELDRVELLTLMDVKDRVESHLTLRHDESAAAERIVDEVVEEYVLQVSGEEMEALIGELRRSVEEIRAREVERWLASREGEGAPSREELDRLTRSLVNKLLHDPMIRLRSTPLRNGRGRVLLRSARKLLGLGAEHGSTPTAD